MSKVIENGSDLPGGKLRVILLPATGEDRAVQQEFFKRHPEGEPIPCEYCGEGVKWWSEDGEWKHRVYDGRFQICHKRCLPS